MTTKKKMMIIMTAAMVAVATLAGFLIGGKGEEEKVELVIKENLVADSPDSAIDLMVESLAYRDIRTGEAIIDSNIVLAKQEDADAMVYYFMEEAGSYGNYLMNQQELFLYLRENRIAPDKIEAFMRKDTVPSYLKEMWTVMNDQLLRIELGVGETYVMENYTTRVKPNYALLLRKYEDFVSQEMKGLFALLEGTTWNYSRSTMGGFEPSIIENNILQMQEFTAKYPESLYAAKVHRDMLFQLQVYFGYFPGSRVFNEHDFTIDPGAMKMYEAMAKQDHVLGAKAKQMVEGLEKSQGKMTPELLLIIEDVSETNDNNHLSYWHHLLQVEPQFDGPGLEGSTEGSVTRVLDPETGEVLETIRIP